MITTEQLKDVARRRDELGRYLDIENKKIEKVWVLRSEFWSSSLQVLSPGVLIRFSITVTKNHDQKASWKGKGLFG